jgi:tRNA A37 threonylcarbamoyladenosine dehydratase
LLRSFQINRNLSSTTAAYFGWKENSGFRMPGSASFLKAGRMEKLKMRIAVVGAGPIGGNFGARIARQGEDITLIDVDAEHVRAIQKKRLQVDVPGGNFNLRVHASSKS